MTSPTSDEQPFDCGDFYVAPTKKQLDNLENGTAPKIFCFKRGFLKGCAWGHPEFQGKCSEMDDEKFKMISEHFSKPNSSDELYFYGHGGPFDFTKQCVCDTDYCNDGNKPPVGPFIMIIIISLFSIVAAL